MSTKFNGFPQDTLKFLNELKKNNNREWFNDNKPRYITSIVEPMGEFIIAMQAPLKKISPHFIANPKPHGGSMFRIYRDARFSKNKDPYKTNVGCHFRHEAGKDAHAPGFYLHIEPGNVFFGGGVWMPPNPVLGKIRTIMVAFPKSWQLVLDDKGIKKLGGIQGDGLKRIPRGYAQEHPFAEDLKRKSFFLLQNSTNKIVHTPDFIKEVNKVFKATSPMMKFLTKSLELPY